MMSTEIDPQRFGEAVRRIRKIRNLTLQDLAKAMDVSESFLSMVENGVRNLSQPQTNALARVLAVDVWWLGFLGTPPTKKRNEQLGKIAEKLGEVIFKTIAAEEGKRWEKS